MCGILKIFQTILSQSIVNEKDSIGKIEWSKAKLVAKGFTQHEGINFNDTYSLSGKNSFRIIMALVALFNLE